MAKQVKSAQFSGTTDPSPRPYEARHRALSRRAAAEGMVLLKNEGALLPLAPQSAVALYGAGAACTVKGGTGSGDVNQRETVNIWQGMAEAGFRIANEEWLNRYKQQVETARLAWRDGILAEVKGENGVLGFFEAYCAHPFAYPAGDPPEKTDADTALYIWSRIAGEGADRSNVPGDYRLSPEEERNLSTLCGLYRNVVLVLNTGGLVELDCLERYPNIRAVLQIVQPGMEGGRALADIVSGAVTPSGKLTDTWALQYADYPSAATFSHNNGNLDEEWYTEGIYLGYRYFDSFGVPVRFGFGSGLSYADLSLHFAGASLAGTTLQLQAEVRNNGRKYAGREVAQVYISCPAAGVEKEYRRLAGYAKTRLLAPGESETLTIEIPVERLASFDDKLPGWVLDPGRYGVWLGNSLQGAALCAVMTLDRRAVLETTAHLCPPVKPLGERTLPQVQRLARQAAWEAAAAAKQLPVLPLRAADLPACAARYDEAPRPAPGAAARLADALTVEQLISLATSDAGMEMSGMLGAAGISVPGAAGETSACAVTQGIANLVLADGPAGLRLQQHYDVQGSTICPISFRETLDGGFFAENTVQQGQRWYQYCTAFPVGTLLAQSWDTMLVAEVGRAVAEEMRQFGVTLWLAPGMNLHRNPLCGRNFEYYAEDPLLSGQMAAAMTAGVQSVPGCGTTIKHFACNNQEDNRNHVDSIVSERALRELYWKGFEIAVKTARPHAIMTSYNRINGIHSANSLDLCTKLARNEWGFDGVIMTDWLTTQSGDECCASGCLLAGNDLVMPGLPADKEELRAALAVGRLPEKTLRAGVSHLLAVAVAADRYTESEI